MTTWAIIAGGGTAGHVVPGLAVARALVAAVLAAGAAGLWRLAAWARGPIIVLQILLGLLAFSTAFQAQRPLIGLPVLVLVASVLYLLATPASRLAFLQRR